jgi:hypothetical protein
MNIRFTLSLLIAISLSTGLSAQTDIPNGNFENWTIATVPPAGWMVVNGSRLTKDSVVKPHSGLYALSIRNTGVSLGTALNVFPFTQKPVSFEGYFGFIRDNTNENFEIVIALTRWDTITDSRDTISYTEFSPVIALPDLAAWSLVQFNLDYDSLNLFNPDTATVLFHTAGGTQFFVGTTLTVDDAGFKDFGAGINDKGSGLQSLKIFNYPNPFPTTTEIVFTLEKGSEVNITLFDITGKEVSRIFSGKREAGENRISFDGSGLQSGVYFYSIQAEDVAGRGRMLINR